MTPQKITKFNELWLRDEKFKIWLSKDSHNDKVAFCKLCLCSIDLSNMGKAALVSHAKSKKHQGSLRALSLNDLPIL